MHIELVGEINQKNKLTLTLTHSHERSKIIKPSCSLLGPGVDVSLNKFRWYADGACTQEACFSFPSCATLKCYIHQRFIVWLQFFLVFPFNWWVQFFPFVQSNKLDALRKVITTKESAKFLFITPLNWQIY
jgi:hypothetical protein